MFGLLLFSALAAMPYDQAYAQFEGGKPMLIMVTADWCPACQKLKSGPIASMIRQGKLNAVSFTIIDVDRQPAMARKLMKTGVVPQLILFKHRDGKIQRRQLIGGQPASRITELIEQE